MPISSMAIITLLSRTNRSGTVVSAGVNVPADVTGRYWLRTNILNTQIVDPTRSITINVEFSTDGGINWLPWCSMAWTGSATIWKGTGNPGCVFDPSVLRGFQIRAAITMSRTSSVGLVLETL